MNRRAFLRATALTAAGLYVAPELLAAPRRRIFPVGIDLKAARQLVLTGTDIHGNRVEHVLPVVDLGDGHYRANLDHNIELAGPHDVDDTQRLPGPTDQDCASPSVGHHRGPGLPMNRRAFLSTAAAAGAGLVVGDAALEAWDRLTWKRRLFPGWSPRYDGEATVVEFGIRKSQPHTYWALRGYPVVTFERRDGKRECVEVAHELTYRSARNNDELEICTVDGRRLLLEVASPRMGGRFAHRSLRRAGDSPATGMVDHLTPVLREGAASL